MRLIRPPLALAVLAIALATATISPVAHAQVAPPGGWYIDVDSVRVDDPLGAQGDNVGMAVVAFRTRLGPGGAQLTEVWLHRPFQVVCAGARAGTVCPIPDDFGAVHFGSVNRPSLAGIAATGPNGRNTPEIVGTIQYLTYSENLENLNYHLPLDDLRLVLHLTAAAVPTERLTSGVAIGSAAVEMLRYVEAVASIGGSTLPPFVTAMVGVGPELRDQVNLGILARHPTTLLQTSAAVLDPRAITYTHGDQNVRYTTSETVHVKLIRP